MRGLRDFEPDCILVEGPEDAQSLMEYIAHPDLQPPVAVLLYNETELSEASYFPFARFSPEWQATLYGLKKEIPVRLMDLPMSINFTIDRDAKNNPQLAFKTKDLTPAEIELRRDPFGQMAKLAGYEDSERWWEVTFEQNENDTEIFTVIADLMALLRAETKHTESKQTLMREAYMRKHLRKAIKEKFEKIAIVCGAWHVPPLQNYLQYKQSADNVLLRGIKKTKTRATWIPWTYERLSFKSGYRAGVLSPAWYNLLFGNRKEVVIRWMTKAARLLRKEDLEGSPANVIEAVRLAETLASLRGLAIAGIDELREAAITVFGSGDGAALKLIENQLIIGNTMGKVPAEIPVVPLQKDLDKQIKSARLTKERQSTEKLTKVLDLRKDTNLRASYLLHRLSLLRINWGKPMKGSQHKTGSFSETWKLAWKPDFSIRIIEAGMCGNTVENAATNRVQQQVVETDDLSKVAELIEQSLNAALTNAIPVLLKKLQDLSTLTKDPLQLMDALPPLVNIIRYGDTRKTNTQAVEQVVEQLIPRIMLGLPNACQGVDEEVSEQIFQKIQNVNRVIGILNHPDYTQQWYRALRAIVSTANIDRLITGGSIRILYDREIAVIAEVITQMHYALSKNNDKAKAIRWLEGFLFGSGMLLIHNPALWKIIDDWVEQLPPEDFQEILPLLRRAFAKFSAPERQRMLDLAKNGIAVTANQTMGNELIEEQSKVVLPTLQLLLGLKS
ncbi:MAG: DUF5682 family protein [Saprospiraceae bacterium]